MVHTRRAILTTLLLGLALWPRWGDNLQAALPRRRPVVHVAAAGRVEVPWEAVWGSYTIAIVPAGRGACLRILQHAREVFHMDGEGFAVSKDVEDIDGDGVEDIVISEWTGGTHCDQRIHVVELGVRLRHVATVVATHAATARFEDLDGDGRMELRTNDWTFANWRACFADSPAPDVVLRLTDGGFRPAWALMRTPSEPDVEATARRLARHPAWAEGQVPPALWGTMLDWIVSGHGKAATRLLRAAWPASRAGEREGFARAFQAQLLTSPYFQR